MKKSILIVSLLIPLILASCSPSGIPKTEQKATIQSSSGNIQTIATKSGQTASLSWTAMNTVSSGAIEAVKPIPVRILAIQKYNVVLLEDGKMVKQLTVKWNTNKVDTMLCKENNPDEQHIIAYNLLSKTWNYGVVEKEDYPCWVDGWHSVYFAMNLKDGSIELTDISKYIYTVPFIDSEKTINNEKITQSLNSSNYDIVDSNEPARWEVSLPEIKKLGFVKSGKNWIKTINLEKILPKPTEIKREVVKVAEIVKIEPKPTETKNEPTVWTYFFEKENYNGDIKITNLTTNSFDVKFGQTDGNKVGGGWWKAKKQSNGTWLLAIKPEIGNEDPADNCDKMSATLRFSGNTVSVEKVNISWLCVSGMSGLNETIYTKK